MSNKDFSVFNEIKEDNGNQLRLAKLEKLEESAFVEAPRKKIGFLNSNEKSYADETKLLDGWTIWLMYHGKFARDIRQTLQKGGAKVIGEGCHWRTIEKELGTLTHILAPEVKMMQLTIEQQIACVANDVRIYSDMV